MRPVRLLALSAAALLLAAAPLEAQRVATLPARDAVLRSQPRQLFAVGREEGADWEMFSDQLSLAFDAADNLFVLDQQNHRVLVFDRGGRYLRRFGRQGGGPGELLAPSGLAITTAGEVVIPDLGARAYVIFSLEGSHLRNVPFEEGAMPFQETLAHPAGGVVSRTNFMPAFGGGGQVTRADLAAGVTLPPPALRRIPLDGGAPRTLVEIGDPAVVRGSSAPEQGGATRITVSRGPTRLFEPRFSWGVLPNGRLAVHRTDAYRIEMLDAEGRVTAVLERPLTPRAVTRRDQEQALAAYRERLTSGAGMRFVGTGGAAAPRGLPPEFIEQQLREMTFAETIPTIQAMFADVSGRLWVERPGAVFGEPGGPIDLISPQGRYIGTLNGHRLPAAVSRGGRAAWVERTELDVPRVVVRQLPDDWS